MPAPPYYRPSPSGGPVNRPPQGPPDRPDQMPVQPSETKASLRPYLKKQAQALVHES